MTDLAGVATVCKQGETNGEGLGKVRRVPDGGMNGIRGLLW